MQTLRDIAPWLAPAAGALAVVALVLAAVLWARLRSVRRAQLVVMGAHDQRDIVAHSEQLASQVRNLRQAVERLTDDLEAQKRRLEKTLTHRTLVRYDAFRDAGGQQSATLVLLDDYRSGFVLSAIAARDFARVYVKTLEQGVADRDLSPEERRAVAEAVPDPLPPRPSLSAPSAAASGAGPGPVEAIAAAGDTAGEGAVPGEGDAPSEPPVAASRGQDPEGRTAAGQAATAGAPAPPRRRSPLAVDDDFVWESPGERGRAAPAAGGTTPERAGAGLEPGADDEAGDDEAGPGRAPAGPGRAPA